MSHNQSFFARSSTLVVANLNSILGRQNFSVPRLIFVTFALKK
jgi:hypothetical protein